MSLWVDKYRPNCLTKLDYHKTQALHLKNLVCLDIVQNICVCMHILLCMFFTDCLSLSKIIRNYLSKISVDQLIAVYDSSERIPDGYQIIFRLKIFITKELLTDV